MDINHKRRVIGLTALVGKVTVDNIYIEHFWRSAQCDRTHLNEYQNISEPVIDIDGYIEFYNCKRSYEILGIRKTMNVYQESTKLNQEKKSPRCFT